MKNVTKHPIITHNTMNTHELSRGIIAGARASDTRGVMRRCPGLSGGSSTVYQPLLIKRSTTVAMTGPPRFGMSDSPRSK